MKGSIGKDTIARMNDPNIIKNFKYFSNISIMGSIVTTT